VFGPVTLTWFVVIATLGARQLVSNPMVLLAVDPRHAVRFFEHHQTHGFLMLGGVVLAITGVEALYADMGHFGRGPSAPPGRSSFGRRFFSITSVKGRFFWPIPPA